MRTITIYTKGVCPFCSMAKGLLQAKGLNYTEKTAEEHPQEFAQMVQENNYYTVPMIVIDGEFIGGFSELKKMENAGEL